MTTHGDQIFQFGGVPVASNRLLPADARLVAPTGDYAPYKHWYPRWKKSKFHTTIPVAYNACAGSKNEVVHLAVGDHTLDETLTWSKNDTHLFGTSPNRYQPHLDIWMSTAFTPMIEISGRGNVFADMTFRHGTDAADVVGALVSGRYNSFDNVYFYTPNNAALGDATLYRGLKVTGHNNYFYGCKIGASGAARGAKNYTLEVEGYENVFENCTFCTFIDATSPHFLGMCIDAGTEGRVTQFLNCRFISYSVNLLTAMAYAIDIGTYAGAVYFDSRCQFIGVTEIVRADHSARIYYSVTGATTTDTDSMIALKGKGVTT